MTTTTIQEKKRRKKTKSQQEIFEWAKKEIYKAAELFHKRKSDIIFETAKQLEESGIEPSKICAEITKGLQEYVDGGYIRDVLKEYPQYKSATKAKKNRKSVDIHAFHEENEEPKQSQEQKQTQEDIVELYENSTDDAPSGEYQIKVEQYNIDDVHLYDRKFLIELVRYLHKLKSQK